MLKILLTAILFVLMGGVNLVSASAVEVDLTSFANADSATHSHVFKERYDEQQHWKECELCALKQNIAEHVLSTYDTNPQVCSSNNVRRTSCSGCAYSKTENPNIPHTWGTSTRVWGGYSGSDSSRVVYVVGVPCDVCGTYNNVPAQHADGSVIDWETAEPPVDVYLNGEYQRTVTEKKFYYNSRSGLDSLTWDYDENSHVFTVNLVSDTTTRTFRENASIGDAVSCTASFTIQNATSTGSSTVHNPRTFSLENGVIRASYNVVIDPAINRTQGIRAGAAFDFTMSDGSTHILRQMYSAYVPISPDPQITSVVSN